MILGTFTIYNTKSRQLIGSLPILREPEGNQFTLN